MTDVQKLFYSLFLICKYLVKIFLSKRDRIKLYVWGDERGQKRCKRQIF